MFFNADKEMKRLRDKHTIETLEQKITELQQEKNKIASLEQTILVKDREIAQLKADLSNAKKDVEVANDKAKSQYAEHVMSTVDERTKEMKAMYEGYAKQIVEVVKASAHPLPVLVTEKTVETKSR